MRRRDRLLLAFAQYQQGALDRATFLSIINLVLDAPPDAPVPAVVAPVVVVEAPRAPIEDLGPLVSVQEVARRYGVSPSTVYYWIRAGTVDSVPTRGGVRIGLRSVLTARARAFGHDDNNSPTPPPEDGRGTDANGSGPS
jgi:excisionase family DNA binding protein